MRLRLALVAVVVAVAVAVVIVLSSVGGDEHDDDLAPVALPALTTSVDEADPDEIEDRDDDFESTDEPDPEPFDDAEDDD